MFRFWYRFIPENTSIISRGAVDLAYSRIAPHLSEYMGAVFEEICKQYLWHELLKGNTPVNFSDLGRWWGNNPKTKQQTEIDIMGTEGKEKAIFGECKWTNADIDTGVLDTLVERSELFNFNSKHLYLFAKNGFTQGCIEKAKEYKNVTLVNYADILNEK